MFASQLPSGCWVHYLRYKQESDQPLAVTMDITLEFGGEISDVLYDLAGAGLIAWEAAEADRP